MVPKPNSQIGYFQRNLISIPVFTTLFFLSLICNLKKTKKTLKLLVYPCIIALLWANIYKYIFIALHFLEIDDNILYIIFSTLLFIYLFIFKFYYIFGHTVWHAWSYFPDQGSNPCPLQWTCRILTTGLPGNSLHLTFLLNQIYWRLPHVAYKK